MQVTFKDLRYGRIISLISNLFVIFTTNGTDIVQQAYGRIYI